jgi:metallopeptidase MepB
MYEYALANAVASKINDDPNFDAESRHYVATFRRRLLQSGAALQPGGDNKTRLEVVQKRIAYLEGLCKKNLNGNTAGIWLSHEELSGVPADVIKRLSQREGDDKFWLTFKVPDTTLVLKYATSAETRRKVYYGNENRMNENIPLFQELLLLRHEAA